MNLEELRQRLGRRGGAQYEIVVPQRVFNVGEVRGIAFVAQHRKVIGARFSHSRVHLSFLQVRQLDVRILLCSQGDRFIQGDAPRFGARNAREGKQREEHCY